jgi:hypothetical protein
MPVSSTSSSTCAETGNRKLFFDVTARNPLPAETVNDLFLWLDRIRLTRHMEVRALSSWRVNVVEVFKAAVHLFHLLCKRVTGKELREVIELLGQEGRPTWSKSERR